MRKGTALRGKAAPAYGTGRSETQGDGYVRIRVPGHSLAMSDGYVLEHRLVWYQHHGDIPPGFEVHHKDRNRTNNLIGNLEMLSSEDHRAEHAQPGSTLRNQYGEWIVGTGQGKAWRQKKAQMGDRFCARCGLSISTLRTDARYCGSRCQVAAFKARRRA